MSKAARLDDRNPWVAQRRAPARRALLGATVGPRNGQLHGVDFVRIDGARWSIHQLERMRRDQWAPALLDLPGPRTPRRHGTLTRSEFLLYAATESWEWINLRGLECETELERARHVLPEKVRLSATITSVDLLPHRLERLLPHLDLVFLDEIALAATLDPLRWLDLLQATLLESTRQGTPCLLASELLPSMFSAEEAGLEELTRLNELLTDGCSGFLLDRETCDEPRAQAAVNILRLVTERRRLELRRTGSRAAASVGAGRPSRLGTPGAGV